MVAPNYSSARCIFMRTAPPCHHTAAPDGSFVTRPLGGGGDVLAATTRRARCWLEVRALLCSPGMRMPDANGAVGVSWGCSGGAKCQQSRAGPAKSLRAAQDTSSAVTWARGSDLDTLQLSSVAPTAATLGPLGPFIFSPHAPFSTSCPPSEIKPPNFDSRGAPDTHPAWLSSSWTRRCHQHRAERLR